MTQLTQKLNLADTPDNTAHNVAAWQMKVVMNTPELRILVDEPKLFVYWKCATYWLEQAKQEEDPQTYTKVEKRFNSMSPSVEKARIKYDQVRDLLLKQFPGGNMAESVLKFVALLASYYSSFLHSSEKSK